MQFLPTGSTGSHRPLNYWKADQALAVWELEVASRVRRFACSSGSNGVLEVEQREVASTSDMTFIEA